MYMCSLVCADVVDSSFPARLSYSWCCTGRIHAHMLLKDSFMYTVIRTFNRKRVYPCCYIHRMQFLQFIYVYIGQYFN